MSRFSESIETKLMVSSKLKKSKVFRNLVTMDSPWFKAEK